MKEVNSIIKTILLAAIVVVFFLLALGLRYERINNDVILDTWTRRIYVFPTEEMPVVMNGKIITSNK